MRTGERKEWKAVLEIILLTMSMLTLACDIQPAKANETIYIRADGSVDPPDAPISTLDNVTYTFTDNISVSIVVERDNIVVEGTGYILQGTGSGTGIDLTGRSNVTIKNTEIKAFTYGIMLYNSSSNSIHESNIKANNYVGIALESSNYNSIYGNNITNNEEGVWLYDSSNYNSIYGNDITETNEISIELSESSNYNSIYGNNITNNDIGIWLSSSSSNSIYENNITNNRFGIELSKSPNNSIYHNNFVDNLEQVSLHYNPTNVWDDSYPSGGNYWSNYNGTDLYKGPHQNETDSDGIGDVPYVIDEDNRDRYPLMSLYRCIHAVAVEDVRPDKIVLRQGFTTKIHVDIANQGHFIETFNVTVYANTTIIDTLVDVTLTDGDSTTVTFLWITTGVALGNYTITAYATPVLGEMYATDNTHVNGIITILALAAHTGGGSKRPPVFYVG